MVVAATRAYGDLIRWVKSARPRDLPAWWFARRDWLAALNAGILVMGSIGLLSPPAFAAPSSVALGRGWPSLALLGIMLPCATYAAAKAARIKRAVLRMVEPWTRPPSENPAWDGAVGALAACPSPLRTRFAVEWVWGPALGVALATTFAFSCAYFIVDAVLARFLVGWEQVVYGASFAGLSLGAFRVVAVRVATWRLCVSVRREVAQLGPR